MKKLPKLTALCCFFAALILLTACGSKPVPAAHVDMQRIFEQIQALPDTPEMLLLSEKRMQTYYGVDPAACPQAVMAVSSDGLRVDEIWLVETSGEEAAKDLTAKAESRIKQVCTETENYLPDQYAVAKEGKVVRIGNNVALFVSPQAEALEKLFRQAFDA